MAYNTKNYTEQGGEKTVIGGELNIKGEGQLTFEGTKLIPANYQSNSEATTIAGLVVDFNKLLAKLKAAGVMAAVAPVIAILTQPADITVTEGSIIESLAIEAEVSSGVEPTYQWYSNETDSNTGGTLIAEATDALFVLPDDLTEGTYYYYCVVNAAEAESVASEVATVTVETE